MAGSHTLSRHETSGVPAARLRGPARGCSNGAEYEGVQPRCPCDFQLLATTQV